jgi:antitoxin VapB
MAASARHCGHAGQILPLGTELDRREPLAFSIADPETERLARSLADAIGETITTATRRAIEERLVRVGPTPRKETSPEDKAALLAEMAEIRRKWSAMPVLDSRSADEIIGYDENGLPGRW